MSDVVVVGAGALGGWTALHLLRSGHSVTLVDAWGPGHARASSGGETRVIRRAYGPKSHYVRLVSRALQHWKEFELEQGERLFDPRGVLWLISEGSSGDFERESLNGLRTERSEGLMLDRAALRTKYPALNTDDIESALFEPNAGVLLARRSCEVVWRAITASGGVVRIAQARPGKIGGGICRGVELSDGSSIEADAVVFACGPWLPKLFPKLIAPHLTVTKQEVMAFGLPPGDVDHRAMPVWADHTSQFFGDESFWYGIPGGLSRSFKVGEDTWGQAFDPTTGERQLDADRVERARKYLAHRFPGLAGAPLVDSRVCQYSMMTDRELVLDHHPDADNLWILGGGSGHGFKLGPAMGEITAKVVLGNQEALVASNAFRLSRSSLGTPS